MLVTFLGHAGLFVNAADKTFLFDPWFHEPVFGNAWYRYPPSPYPNASTMPRPDVLVLSHIHPDHSGPRTLEQITKDARVFAMPFPSGALKRRVDRAGFKQVRWLEPWQTEEVFPGAKLTFVPHHAGWEVSSIVLEADGVRLYHGNDNPLSKAAYEEVARRLGPIDIAFLPFAGASSYPTCFEWDRATIEEKGRQKKAEGIARLTDGIEGLQPREAAPFASSWALLEPDQLWKNYVDRPTPEEAVKAAMPVAARHGTHLLLLESGDQWSPELGAAPQHLVDGWGHDRESIARYAAQMKDVVAQNQLSHPNAPAHALDEAFREYFGELLAKTAAGTAKLSMKAAFVADGQPRQSWRVVFEPGQAPRLDGAARGDEDETLTLSSAELWDLLAGPMNWEDVWYGYRLRVRKREGAGYYRAFWEMLLNFDAEALSERLAAKYR